jgi:hypothetical protein
MKFIVRWLYIVVASAVTSCATVTRGTTDQVQFISNPPGATVTSIVDYPCGGPCPVQDHDPGSTQAYIPDNVRTPEVPGPSCITPCLAQVDRNKVLIVTFTKAGYVPQRVKVRGKMNSGGAAGLAGNLIVGGAVGAVTDAATGATLDHCPNPVIVHLQPIGKSGGAPPAGKINDPCV